VGRDSCHDQWLTPDIMRGVTKSGAVRVLFLYFSLVFTHQWMCIFTFALTCVPLCCEVPTVGRHDGCDHLVRTCLYLARVQRTPSFCLICES
jgi:hypothetical protein